MRKSITPLLNLIFLLGTLSCSQQKISDQERRREQEIAAAESLRQEYKQVVGVYTGELLGDNDYQQDVTLSLSIQDIPVVVEGQVDPVLTPKLVGQLRLVFSELEFIDAPIQSSEYFAAQKRLNLLVNHSQTGEMSFNLVLSNSQLSGTWVAPTAGNSGTTTLNKEESL